MDYLLFFVGGEEYLSAENEEKINQEMRLNHQMLVKAQSTSTTYHLWLIRLRLKAKKDNTAEEFELYTTYGLGTGYTFGARTSHQFNGGWHTDASGYTRLYPDVNDKNIWYTPSHPIAVTYDGYHTFQFTAIEDDYSTGSHKNDHDGGGKHSEGLYGWEFVERVAHNPDIFWFYIDDDVTDDDDIYECSYAGWDADPNNYQEMSVSTDHVDYVFRLGTVYQADNNWP